MRRPTPDERLLALWVLLRRPPTAPAAAKELEFRGKRLSVGEQVRVPQRRSDL
jgi:hypothetical protein